MKAVFNMPTRLFIGINCIQNNRKVFSDVGKRCLIVTGHKGAKLSGALDAVTALLGELNVEYALFSEVEQNPTVESCLAAGRRAFEFEAEYIIGIGGGSALDAAKVAGIAAGNPEMTEAVLYSQKWENKGVPVILVGTTSGTGSEVTSVAVLTDSTHRKHSIHDDRLYASYSFGDATFTMSASERITATTGIDVLAHCVESYFSAKADEISGIFATEGIKLFLSAVRETDGFKQELSLLQREKLYTASIYAGLAINTTGTVFPHTLGYLMTEKFGLSHGFASAMFMPELILGAQSKLPDYTGEFFRKIGCGYDEFMNIYNKIMPPDRFYMSPEEIETIIPRYENNKSIKNTAFDLTTDDIRKCLVHNTNLQ